MRSLFPLPIENLLEQLAEHGFTAELPETAPDSPDTAENNEAEEVPDEEGNAEHGETAGLTIYLPKDKANIDLTVCDISPVCGFYIDSDCLFPG